MKLNSIIILVFASILALFHTACATGPLTKQQLAADALKDAAAIANGFVSGGQSGALLGLSVQEVANLNALAAKANTTVIATAPATPAPNTLLPTIPVPTAP